MLETNTATTATTTAPLSTLPMSLSSSPQTNSTTTSHQESVDSPDTTMPQFVPGQCLFCPKPSPSFADSVVHMRKSHGLFVPHQQHLSVDLETLLRYLHLIIFGYRECIKCGTERATVQAVQQHMTGKGHCNFDTTDEDSEFAEFYDFSESESASECETEGDGDERNLEETIASSSQKPLPAGQDSIRLPSGKIISRQSSAQTAPSFTQLRRRARTYASRLEHSTVEAGEEEEGGSSKDEPDSDIHDMRLLSKREKRERATVTYQLANMSANDRNGLIHLPTSEQRSILTAQFRHAVKVQKEEKRRQSKVDRKGNKNLYAYWHTETPVYQCG